MTICHSPVGPQRQSPDADREILTVLLRCLYVIMTFIVYYPPGPTDVLRAEQLSLSIVHSSSALTSTGDLATSSLSNSPEGLAWL